eukprot:TRINITY_DN7592_c0_g1_i2.p1 TRINITY_DN7592_c0_g1~~TRINITY_DN7592_c0_g1_i2.p1  ORF type:complete len:289 (+),score=89.32 TRINITY_DN7592_c0_g1_i2:110-976(+)
MEYRQQRIEKENEVKRKAQALADLNTYHEKLAEEDNALEAKFEAILRELRSFHVQRFTECADLDILLKLKQGQVEVDQAATVTDYSGSALIHRSQIENLNHVIRSLGKQKVDLLVEVKDTKKMIRKKKWDNKSLDMIGEDLVERTKYFQLLRVTKQLQSLIKGGEEDLHAQENADLENRQHHAEKSHEQKLNEKRKLIKKYKRLIAEKVAENKELELHLIDLEASVNERQRIFDIQAQQKTSESGFGQKTKKIAHRSKLKAAVLQQKDLIHELEQELAMYQQRTFPFL